MALGFVIHSIQDVNLPDIVESLEPTISNETNSPNYLTKTELVEIIKQERRSTVLICLTIFSCFLLIHLIISDE